MADEKQMIIQQQIRLLSRNKIFQKKISFTDKSALSTSSSNRAILKTSDTTKYYVSAILNNEIEKYMKVLNKENAINQRQTFCV